MPTEFQPSSILVGGAIAGMLTILTAVISVIASIVPDDFKSSFAVIVVTAGIWAIFVLFASLSVATRQQDEITQERLKTSGYAPLYKVLAHRVLGYFAFVFGQPAFLESHLGVWERLRATCTLKLLDRAILFAVAYPSFIILVFWALSPSPLKIENEVFVPVRPSLWLGSIVVGSSVFVIVAPYVEALLLRSRTTDALRNRDALRANR